MERSSVSRVCEASLRVFPSCKDSGPNSLALPRGEGSGRLTVEPNVQLMAGGNHGKVVIPGIAVGSDIIRNPTMGPPPFGAKIPLGGTPLPDSAMQIIRDWINRGALNN